MLKRSTTVLVDNQGAIDLKSNCSVKCRTKHNDDRLHFYCAPLRECEIILEYRPIKSIIADLMTKPLRRIKFTKFMEQCRL